MVREALFSDSGDGLLEEGHTYKGQISIRIKCHLIDAKEDNNNKFENINTLFFSSLPCFMKGGDGCRHDICEKKFRYHIFRVKRKNAQLLRKCKRIGFFSEKIAATTNFPRPAVWIDVAFLIFGNSMMHLEKKLVV